MKSVVSQFICFIPGVSLDVCIRGNCIDVEIMAVISEMGNKEMRINIWIFFEIGKA